MTFRAANNVDKLSKLFFSSGYKIAVQIAKTGDSDPAKKVINYKKIKLDGCE